MKKSVQKRIFLVFVTLITIGVLMTGTLSITLTKILVPEMEQYPNLKDSIIRYQLISVIIGLSASLFLGSKYIKQATEPIKQLTNITKKISRGDYFGQRIRTSTSDELDELSENFNLMSIRLEGTINKLKENSSKLEAVLKSMTDGVIAIDNNKNIIIANPTVKKMFGIGEKEVIGKHISEAFRNSDLTDSVEGISLQNRSKKTEIVISEPVHRVLSIKSGVMKSSFDPNRLFGIVIMVHDITEVRKLENMRKDFVANVSHELKTPLTSIKGFVETLRSGNIEDEAVKDRFLSIIDIESDRLGFLIDDLLVLSEIENEENRGRVEAIDIENVVSAVLNLLENMARKKNVSLIFHMEDSDIRLYGDKTRFQQMLMNLLDNGIKYTSEGGEVRLSVFRENKNINIVVADTGMGIPKESLDRLFERFYRVDKARSRQIGGTGLGLAIVKHIVISFGGEIKVSSEENLGTEFVVQIPEK